MNRHLAYSKTFVGGVLALSLACVEQVLAPAVIAPVEPPAECRYGQATMTVAQVPPCLAMQGMLSVNDGSLATEVFARAMQYRDSLRTTGAIADFTRAAEITRALQRIVDFYSRRLFSDSARFHRMLDHVLVTIDHVRGTGRWIGGRFWPQTTPFLAWIYYPQVGLYFQPGSTVQAVVDLLPRSTVATDSLLTIGEQLYRYALWRQHDDPRFPVWEYLFPWSSSGVTVLAPWISGQAQAHGIILFAENYRRTRNPLWRVRAFEVLNSYKISWDDGGVLVADTSHGYWWEEFHPTVFIGNGSAQAVIAMGYLRNTTEDPEVARMFARAVEAMKYYTPEFDTGSWTLYSRTAGYNTIAYHNVHIKMMDALYSVSGDPWFKEVADRWRTYVPPPGVQ